MVFDFSLSFYITTFLHFQSVIHPERMLNNKMSSVFVAPCIFLGSQTVDGIRLLKFSSLRILYFVRQ